MHVCVHECTHVREAAAAGPVGSSGSRGGGSGTERADGPGAALTNEKWHKESGADGPAR